MVERCKWRRYPGAVYFPARSNDLLRTSSFSGPPRKSPLARWAKVMMTVQSLVATTTVALVFARAISLLK